MDRAVARANERLTGDGQVPLPERLTPHKLRHTFASLLVALGTDAGVVMDQLGHTSPVFTLSVYRHAMRGDAVAKRALRELVGQLELSDAASPAAGGLGIQRAASPSNGHRRPQ